MIHHISIPANDPSHVADVLAALMGGRSYPFPGSIPDSFMAVAGDNHGTMIEVYPADMTLEPNGRPNRQPGQKPKRGPYHALLSVPLSREQIEEIGNREGWTTRFCGRVLCTRSASAPSKPMRPSAMTMTRGQSAATSSM